MRYNINDMIKNVLILFSGGIDSTLCIHYYQKLGYNVKGLFIDYGQPAALKEKIATECLSSYLKIETLQIKTDLRPNIEKGLIQGRNYLLLSISLSCFPFTEGIISLGIHSGTKYADCSPNFIELNQKIFDLYTNGNIVIDCPFLLMNKNDIYRYFLKSTIPIELTYSCELGGDTPCGKCLTCLDIKALKNESKD